MDCTGFKAAAGDIQAECPCRRIRIADPEFTGGGCKIRFALFELRIGDLNLSAAGTQLDHGVL